MIGHCFAEHRGKEINGVISEASISEDLVDEVISEDVRVSELPQGDIAHDTGV